MRFVFAAVLMAGCSSPAHVPLKALPTPAAHIEVQGHRGARAVLPEESLPAFAHAIEVGADVLELDLGVTKDGHLVVLHDLLINDQRCLDGEGKRLTERPPVISLTLAEVKRFDCGSLPHERFPNQKQVPGTRIATLGEVFELAAKSRVGFNIELKSVPARPELTPLPDVFARKVLDEARAHGMLERITIQSFDHRMLAAVKKQAPKIPISLSIEGTLPDLVALAENAHAEIVSPNLDWIVADDVRALHAKGIRVIPWTANKPEEWNYLAGIGVDGIISDDPASLIAWLKARSLR
jgi:glycerophosphoryl diester phosphodiesterase